MNKQIQNLTVKEVAARLNTSYYTALGYIHKGYIRGIRKGGQWEVSEEELARYQREGNYKEEQK